MQVSRFLSTVMIALFPMVAAAGEFSDNCATGLAIYDVAVKTDCSVNWTDDKTGKTYCFSSAGTKNEFLEDAEKKHQEIGEELRKVGKELVLRSDAGCRQRCGRGTRCNGMRTA